MSAASIRPLAEADHDVWLALWRGYQAFYKVELGPVVEAATWSRLLDPSEPVHGAVAVEGARAIGLVHWICHRSCWTVGDYGYLQDLFVASERRGTGAGRRLIEHVYSQAKAAGCSRVYWLTHETNRDAMHLYDKVADRSGFIQYRKILA